MMVRMVCALFLFTASGWALNIQGTITGDAVWEAGDSPVHVTGNVVVPAGASLKIEPGVRVVFDDYFHLEVQGVLEAVGTPQKNIIFTSDQKRPEKRGWKGLVLAGEKCKTVLSDCVVENAFRNFCWKTAPVIRSTTFQNNTYGFYCSNTRSVMIYKCTFTENVYGIYCDYSAPTVQGNLIVKNDFGIYCIFSSAPLVGQNTIQGNTTKDIFLDDSMGKNEVTARTQYIWSLVKGMF